MLYNQVALPMSFTIHWIDFDHFNIWTKDLKGNVITLSVAGDSLKQTLSHATANTTAFSQI